MSAARCSLRPRTAPARTCGKATGRLRERSACWGRILRLSAVPAAVDQCRRHVVLRGRQRPVLRSRSMEERRHGRGHGDGWRRLRSKGADRGGLDTVLQPCNVIQGEALWKSDGTTSGTVQIQNFGDAGGGRRGAERRSPGARGPAGPGGDRQPRYDTGIDDLWDALIQGGSALVLPVSGELKLGGSYQIQGNAGGTITACAPPRACADLGVRRAGHLGAWLTADGEGTRLTLEHMAPIDPHWEQSGPRSASAGT